RAPLALTLPIKLVRRASGSIFDRSRDFANHRPRSETRARRGDLVDDPGDDYRAVPVERRKTRFHHVRRVHRDTFEDGISAKAGNLAELRSCRARAKAGHSNA